MQQAILKKGKVISEIVPEPLIQPDTIKIKVINSAISSGTEMSSVNNSSKSTLKRVIENPDFVKQALNSISSIGLLSTYSKVKGKLDSGTALGYSLSGVVIEVGKNVDFFQKGDKVAAAGVGFANHSEVVIVPKNLVVKIPQNVSFEEASTVALGSIALHGVRRADLNIGETCAVIGTGILGLITIQLLSASGIDVIAIDIDDSRLEKAMNLGAKSIINSSVENIEEKVSLLTDNLGVDAVIFTAATKSSKPMSDGFKICRKKGKFVLVGVSGMEISRSDIYSKEIDFLISSSYGPGRYDPKYEIEGMDYPIAYVRWTENRNMRSYLELIDNNRIQIKPIIDKIFNIDNVMEAYEFINSEKPLIVLLKYNNQIEITDRFTLKTSHKPIIKNSNELIRVAIVGAGSFVTSMHVPNLLKMKKKFKIHAVMSTTAMNAKVKAENFGAFYSTTDFSKILEDGEIDLVFITSPHDTHGDYVLKALKSGKNVFVEKPLSTSKETLLKIKEFMDKNETPPLLFVGYNRRFSVHTKKIQDTIKNRKNPVILSYRMSVNYLPKDENIHRYGGRIVGELCHIIDLASAIIKSEPKNYYFERLNPKSKYISSDNVSLTIKFEDNSIATINYFSIGSSQIPKEYLEVHVDGESYYLDDFKKVSMFGNSSPMTKTKNSDKGHFNQLLILHKALVEMPGQWPISFQSLFNTSHISLSI